MRSEVGVPGPKSESIDIARTIVSGLEGAMLVARPYGDPQKFRITAALLLAGILAESES